MGPMKKRMMLFNPYACREKTADDWVATLRLGGIDAFSPKFWNGSTLQGFIQGHQGHYLSPRSLDDCKRLYDDFGARGIVLIPWGIPHGYDPVADANLAADIALACGSRVEVDLEPYGRETPNDPTDDFWVGPYDGIPTFFAQLKDRGVEYVIANFDARPPGYNWSSEYNLADPLHLWDSTQYIDLMVTQSYDVGFSLQAGRTIDYHTLYATAAHYMERCEARSRGIVADARAGFGIAERADFAQQLGCKEIAAWAGDMATPATYAGFAAVPTQPYLDSGDDDLTDTQREVLVRALTVQYDIVHNKLHPLARAAGFDASVEAYVGTYDQQLNDIKSAFPDLF